MFIAANDNHDTLTGGMCLEALRMLTAYRELDQATHRRLRSAVYWLNADEFDTRGYAALDELALLLTGKLT